MNSPEPRQVNKIVSIGLASSVLTASMTGAATAQEIDNQPHNQPTPAPATTPATQPAPTEEEISHAQEALNAAEQAHNSAASDTRAHEEALANEQNTLDELTTDAAQYTSDRERLQALTTDELGVQQAALDRAVSDAQTTHTNANTQVNDAQSALEQARTQHADAEREHANANTTLSENTRAYDEALTPEDLNTAGEQPTTSELNERITALTVERDQLREQLSQAEETKARLLDEQRQAETEREAQQRGADELQAELTQAQERQNQANAERDEAQQRLTDAQNALAQAEAEAGENSPLATEKRESIQRSEEAIRAAENEIASIETTLNDLTGKIGELQAAITPLNASIAQLTSQIEQAQARITESDRDIAANNQKIAEKNAQIEQLTEELRALDADIAREEAKNGAAEFTRDELIVPAAQASERAPHRANAPTAQFTAPQARAERQQAYRNYTKLLPYASTDAIVRAGNLLDANDPLVTKELLSALATVNGRISLDTTAEAPQINGLLLHFADRSVDRRALTHDNRAATAHAPAHYYMAGGLPYTPTQTTAVDTAQVTRIAEALNTVEYNAIPVTTTLSETAWRQQVDRLHKQAVDRAKKANKPAPTREETEAQALNDHRGLLYLRETFANQKAGLSAQLTKLLAQENTQNATPETLRAVEQKIIDNKEAFLLGLAYVNKWYAIAFGDNDLRDLLIFRQDFYGKPRNAVDTLIELGKSYELLDPRRNIETYQHIAAPATGRDEVADALDDLRQQFTTFSTFDDWFKATTKAHIVEEPSRETPETNVQLSKRLRTAGKFKSHLLPLLTVSDDSVFVTVHITSVAFGTFERYYNTKQTSAADRPAVISNLKKNLAVIAKKYRDYYDMWYRIGNDEMRINLIRDIPVWDGFSYKLGWTNKYGPGNFRSVEEFYGPTGRWYPANGVNGYSWGHTTHMVVAGMMQDPGGIVTYTHEMVHNIERSVFLAALGKRKNASYEVYPTDFLQNSRHIGHDGWGFNQANYFTDNGGTYLHNKRPDRFQTVTDLDQYFKGYFDALYMLDNAEAEVLLERNAAEKAGIFMHLGNHPSEGKRHLNSYDVLTEDQIQNMNLRTITDLVDNELMIRRGQAQTGPLHANGYWGVSILEPLYGTAESNLGVTGESAFKRNAYELLAAKGYFGGFVPYASNQYGAAAAKAGQPNLPDTFIMPRIFNGDFTSLKEYRKHAYTENRQRARTHLRPINVRFENRDLTFTSYDQIVEHFRTLTADDIARNRLNDRRNSRVYNFKAAIFSALMRQTDEFKTSIFDDGDAALVPWTAPAPEAPEQPYVPVMLERPHNDISTTAFATSVLPETRDESLLASLRERRDNAQTQLDAANTALRELRSTAERLGNEKTQRTSEHANLMQARANAQTELTRTQDLLRRLTTAQTAGQTEIERQRALKAAAEAKRRECAATLSELQARVERARAAAQNAQDDLRARTADATQAQASVTEKEQRLAAARSALNGTQETLAALANDIADAEKLLNSTKATAGDKDTQIARLRALVTLSRAVDAQREIAAAAAEQVTQRAADVERHLTAATSALEQLNDAARTLENARARQTALAGQTVDTLINDDTPATPYTVLHDLIQRLRAIRENVARNARALETQREAVNAAQNALDTARATQTAAATAQQQAREHLDELLRRKAQADAAATEPNVWRLSDNPPTVDALTEFTVPSQWLPRVPDNAPTAEALPEFTIPSDWLQRVPDNAPTAAALPEFTIPSEWLNSPATPPTHTTAPQNGGSNDATIPPGNTALTPPPAASDTQYKPAATAPHATSNASLAHTGANTIHLTAMAAATAAIGWTALKRRRKERDA